MIDLLQDAPPIFDDDYPDVDQRTCRLLGPTALVVQLFMGVLVILSLVFKRHRETPKRPWKIWTFDISKQIAGQMFVHGVNVLISDLVAHHSSGNPCVLYFLNILIDTTLGVAIIYIIHRLLTHLFSDKLHLKGFQSGQYGDPPSIAHWGRQAAVYVFSLTTMKLLVVGLFVLWPGIFKLGAWLLSWTGGGDAVQVIFVMGLFPIGMNIIQFWLIDSIVKASTSQADIQLPNTTPRHSSDQEPLFNSRDDDCDDGAERVPPHAYDIENPRSVEHSRPQSINSRKVSNDEQKYIPSGVASCGAEDEEDVHAYPPRRSLSPSSNSSSSSHIITSSLSWSSNGSHNRFPGKRSPPPPLQIRSLPKCLDSSGIYIIAEADTPLTGHKASHSLTSGLSSVSPPRTELIP